MNCVGEAYRLLVWGQGRGEHVEGMGCRGYSVGGVGLGEVLLGTWISGWEKGLISRVPDFEELPKP